MKKFGILALGFCAFLLAACGLACGGGESGGAPCVFSGAENLRVRANSQVDWTAGVTAECGGKSVEVSADASGVDLSNAGVYTVYYVAGNSRISRTVRVYGMPVIARLGESVKDGDNFTMSYGEVTGVRGFATGFTAKDSFGKELELHADAPDFAGTFGSYDVTWSAEDAAGNRVSVSGTVKIDESKRPTAADAEYDLSEDGVFLNVDLKGAERITMYEGYRKVNLTYYEFTENGILLSGAYFGKYGTGAHDFRLVTEFGYCAFTVEATDTKPVDLSGVSRMDGYLFLAGETVRIPMPDSFGSGHQSFSLQYEVSGLTATEDDGTLLFGTPAAGDYTVKVVAQKQGGAKSEKSFGFRVLESAEYKKHIAPGTANQFTERFMHTGYTDFGFEYLDESVYGEPCAYRFRVVQPTNVWDMRLQFAESTWGTNATRLSDYSKLSFDVYIRTGSGADFHPSSSFTGDKYVNFEVKERDTGTAVSLGSLAAGKWYTFSLAIPSGLPDNRQLWIYFANENKTLDLYLKNFLFS